MAINPYALSLSKALGGMSPASTTMAYTIAQPNREWEHDGDKLISVDGLYEISPDPVYGYYRLFKSEDTTTSIAEHATQHSLVMYVEMLDERETKSVTNTTGYAYYGSNMGPELQGKPNLNPRKTLTVTFITDVVPGAFHHPIDLMKWIATNPYVDTVTLTSE